MDGGEEQQYTAPLRVERSASLSYYATAADCNPSEPVESYFIINETGSSFGWKYPVEICYGREKVGTYLVDVGQTIVGKIPDVAREGYLFEGFYTDADLKMTWNKETDAVNSAFDVLSQVKGGADNGSTFRRYRTHHCSLR